MLCPDCAATLPADFLSFYAPWHYAGTARALVTALKYRCVAEAAFPLAEGMVAVLPPGDYDALVPVPLHAHRLRERGFNQARLLCDALGGLLGLPVLDALCRVRYTKAQAKLDSDARQENVRGAFERCADVRGKRLVLVDDVRTTGATAENCARILREGGAQSVILLTAAIAVPGEDA